MYGRMTDRIYHNVLNDSDVSHFEGDCGNDASNMFKLSMDSGRTVIILISFQMVYGKPYLVTILDLQVDDFLTMTSKLLFLFSGSCQITC